MKRTLLAVAMAVIVLLPVLAAPVAAGARWTQQQGEIDLANQANCGSPNGWRDFAGMENSTSNTGWKRSGVSASIDISSDQFDICTNGGISGIKGVSAWVAIEPHGATECVGPCENNIIQIGVIECRDVVRPGSACYGENNPHFFWAWGGCSVFNVPLTQDLGPADYNPHTYTIYLDTDGFWHFLIDGIQRKTLNDDNIYCWSHHNRKAAWIIERADSGDSSGSVAFKTSFASAAYGVYNQGWFSPLWVASNPCHGATIESKCDITSPTNLLFWTVQQ